MGELVLIHAAAGSVGTAAVQLAHAAGATVFGTSRTPVKLESVKPLGLDVALSATNFADEMKTLTRGEGVHLVIDFIGAPYMEQNLDTLGVWGRIVFLAALGGVQANVNLQAVMSKRLQIRGCTLRYRPLEEKLMVTRRFVTQALPLLASGKIVPVVEHVYPLHEIAIASAVLEENRGFGKIIMNLDA